jgi:lipopolysaccharide/colanic/teichoic acid biosynthesis glycosyltransferase
VQSQGVTRVNRVQLRIAPGERVIMNALSGIWVAIVRRLVRLYQLRRGPRLHSVDKMHELLYRERVRADRSGQQVSLLVLLLKGESSLEAALRHLEKIIRRRLRCTDEAGWLREGSIGLILPGTPAEGAWKLAGDICRSFPEHLAPPACTVHAYPCESGLPRPGRNGAAGAGTEAGEPSRNGAAQHQRERPVQPLESLFEQAMPPWKRCLDIAGALTGLVLLLPLLLAVGVAIKVSSHGPILYGQKRSGKGGRPFTMYKFRTMVVDAEARKKDLLPLNEQDGPAFKITNDPRVTVIGRFLRATSIDELPQLWNVLRGAMSLVGPRPLPCSETAACDRWHRQRLDVTPGLTCIWQVWGRSQVTFDQWVRMDVRYIRRRTLFHDVMILLQTIPVVLWRANGR